MGFLAERRLRRALDKVQVRMARVTVEEVMAHHQVGASPRLRSLLHRADEYDLLMHLQSTVMPFEEFSVLLEGNSSSLAMFAQAAELAVLTTPGQVNPELVGLDAMSLLEEHWKSTMSFCSGLVWAHAVRYSQLAGPGRAAVLPH